VLPNRGLIVDRNGVVLATNYSAYTLEITPSKVRGELDTVIDGLAQVLDVQPRDRRRFKRLQEESKSFESLPIRTKLSDEEVARFTAQRYRFPGGEVRARLFRSYPAGEVGSHLIGYIGRINQAEKQAMEDWDDEVLANYHGTEVIGKLGLEQHYEQQLHGTTGFEEVETSAGGRAVRRLKSHPATPGDTLVLAIDIKLQALGRATVRRPARRAGGDRPALGARCWPSSASPASTPTCSSTASTSRAGAASTRAWTSPCSTARCAAPTRRAAPSSPSWRWPRWPPASARRRAGSNDPGYFMFAGIASAAPRTSAAAS